MRKHIFRLIALAVFITPILANSRVSGAGSKYCCEVWEGGGEAGCCQVSCEFYCEIQTGIPIATNNYCGGPPAWCTTCVCQCVYGPEHWGVDRHEEDPECETCETESGPYYCIG